MKIEEISKVEINDNNELFIILSSGGEPAYQYIYREAAEVYWDNDIKGFKSPPPRTWDHTDWYNHILKIAESGLDLSLKVTNNTNWVNVPEKTKAAILESTNT